MALVDRVTARYSDAQLVALTNPDQPWSTASVDTARLALAASDGEAEFEAIVGAAYDDTDTRHQAVAVLAVEWRLMLYTRIRDASTREAERTFREAAERLAVTRGGRARILPRTNSELTPSDEVQAGETVRPDFDRASLAGISLRAPRAGRLGRDVDED